MPNGNNARSWRRRYLKFSQLKFSFWHSTERKQREHSRKCMSRLITFNAHTHTQTLTRTHIDAAVNLWIFNAFHCHNCRAPELFAVVVLSLARCAVPFSCKQHYSRTYTHNTHKRTCTRWQVYIHIYFLRYMYYNKNRMWPYVALSLPTHRQGKN